MRVGMIQSNYIPWRGYFDFIRSVDIFVLYDDVLFGRGRKWRNRNRIRVGSGAKWLSVPIHRRGISTTIDQVTICYERDWVTSHCSQLRQHYRYSPFVHTYLPGFSAILQLKYQSLSDLNFALISWVAAHLSISTRIIQSSSLSCPAGSKSTRPLMFLERLGATEYLTGPNTLPYTDFSEFQRRGIKLYCKSYDYPSYPQRALPFMDYLTILDLLFNLGDDAKYFIRSQSPDILIDDNALKA